MNRDKTLYWIWDGEGKIKTIQGWRDLKRGVSLFLREGHHYRDLVQNPKKPLGISYFHFEIVSGSRRPFTLNELEIPEVISISDFYDVDMSLKRVLHLLHLEKKTASRSRKSEIHSLAESLFFSTLVRLFQWNDFQKRHFEKNFLGLVQEKIYQAALSIEENHLNGIDFRQLAADLGYKEDRFNRLFFQHIGCTPRRYLFQLKMEKAKQLLAGEDLSVKEIAFYLGYENEFYFSRFFKKEAGCSPLHWRQRVAY